MNRTIVRPLAACVLLILLAPVWAQDPETATSAGLKQIDRALGTLDIPGALTAYDAVAAEGGASQELLARIATADLRFCLKEGKGWDRVEAARALSALDDPAGRAALLDSLDSSHAQIRARVATWLADQGVKEAVPSLKKLAEDATRTPIERLSSAEALFRLGERETGAGVVVALLGAEPPRNRPEAVRVLLRLQDPATLGPLKERLDAPSDEVTMMAAQAVARLGDPAGRERLVEGLASEKPYIRVLAAWHLMGAGSAAGVDAVQAVVSDALEAFPDFKQAPEQVALALYTLLWIDPEGSRPLLDRVLDLEGWSAGRVAAARRLAELADPGAVPALARLYDEFSDDPRNDAYRVDLVRFAGWLPEREGLRDLARKAAGDAGAAVRRAGLELQARLGDEAALGPLREILGGPELGRRVWAAELVLEFGGERPPHPTPFCSVERRVGPRGDRPLTVERKGKWPIFRLTVGRTGRI